jgi:hypothetical protein
VCTINAARGREEDDVGGLAAEFEGAEAQEKEGGTAAGAAPGGGVAQVEVGKQQWRVEDEGV